MAFEKITENVENISLLPNDPTLIEPELKAEFDKGNKTIKTKFNKLVDDLNELDLPKVCETVENSTAYSTEETIIGTWIDEKPIYRKVVDLGRFGSTDSEVTVSGSYDTVVNFYGYIYTSSAKLSLSQYSSSSSWREIFFEVTDGVLKIHLSRDASGQGHWSNFNVKVIVEYTKTTD